MKRPSLALLLALCFIVTPVFAQSTSNLLEPGLYKLDPDSFRTAPQSSPATQNEIDTHRYEHALPAAANVIYAVVTRDPGRTQNRVLFLTDPQFHYDVNSVNKLCPAYALPDWNDYSANTPFCRTGMSSDETRIEGATNSFTLSWPATRSFLGSEFVAPSRKPTPAEAALCAGTGQCTEAAYGTSYQKYEIGHASDRFELVKPATWQGLLYLTKAVPLYASANRAAPHDEIAAASYVAIVTSNDEWEEVERFAPDGTSTHGWVDIDDTLDLTWVDQKAMTKQFRFRVGFIAGDSGDDTARAVVIEVLDRASGKRVQALRDFYSDPTSKDDDNLMLLDANFDGLTDISINGSSGGAGPNSTTNVFLFDPTSQRFIFNKALSDLPQIGFDERHKTVTSEERSSCCSHTSHTWRYVHGELVEIANRDESLSADGRWMVTTVGRLQNGKMQYREKRERYKD